MSEEFELVKAMNSQASALEKNAAVNAANVALQNAQAARAEAKWNVTTRTNLRTNALSFSAKINSHRSVEEVIADAEKMLAWLEAPLRELDLDANT